MMKCGILGGGNMGEALLKSFISTRLFQENELYVVESHGARAKELREKYAVWVDGNSDILNDCHLIILAIKPQDLESARFNPQKNNIILSLLAGVPSDKIKEQFADSQIVRAMPNLGLSVGQGMTGVFFRERENFTQAEIKLIKQCFRAGGRIIEVENECALDAITAISGSGPAYFFYFLEKLSLCSKEMGFTEEEAQLMARQTLLGAMEILKRNSDDSAQLWREKVSSRGGTTEKAIEVFEGAGFQELFLKALKAAEQRSQELGK